MAEERDDTPRSLRARPWEYRLSRLEQITVELPNIEHAVDQIPQIKTNIEEVRDRLASLDRRDAENNSNLKRLADAHEKSFSDWRVAAEGLRREFLQTMEADRKENREALARQEERTRLQMQEVTNAVIEKMGTLMTRALFGRLGQWLLTGIAGLVTASLMYMWTNWLRK